MLGSEKGSEQDWARSSGVQATIAHCWALTRRSGLQSAPVCRFLGGVSDESALQMHPVSHWAFGRDGDAQSTHTTFETHARVIRAKRPARRARSRPITTSILSNNLLSLHSSSFRNSAETMLRDLPPIFQNFGTGHYRL